MTSHIQQSSSLLLRFIGYFDFLAPLLIRFILAPVFIIAGFNKLQLNNDELGFIERLTADPNIVNWFGNAEWGLGLPFPTLLANLAAWAEFLGGWFILIGLLTRLTSIPLLVTMFVAAFSVHAENGWFAVTPTTPSTSPAQVVSWFGFEGAKESLENSDQAARRLSVMRELLEEHGNTDWLYDRGGIVILNNGIEFAATYFVMLLVLLFHGGGRFFSVDYWLFKERGLQEFNPE